MPHSWTTTGSNVLDTLSHLKSHQYFETFQWCFIPVVLTVGMLWASCQIRKIAGYACTGNAGNIFPVPFQRKPLVSDPGMYHGTCVTHVPRCVSGSLTRVVRETIPAFPVHAQPTNLRIWQEAHCGAKWLTANLVYPNTAVLPNYQPLPWSDCTLGRVSVGTSSVHSTSSGMHLLWYNHSAASLQQYWSSVR